MARNNLSVYISYLLRHKPQDIGLAMDRQGWVSVNGLIEGINREGTYTLDRAKLEQIVAEDSKDRYRFSEDGTRIKACQGHSIDGVEPELEYLAPPPYLYHGTTEAAAEKIRSSGAVSKMGRHAVHMQEEPAKAWLSATRWRQPPVLLKINAAAMHEAGFRFGRTENGGWCTESVPIAYVAAWLKEPV